MNETHDKLAKKARAAFDHSVDGLDAATLSRLNRARQKALEERASPASEWWRWAPAAVAVASVAVVLTRLQGPVEIDVMPAPLAEVDVRDIDILLGEESIEMLEDLEFYAWLELENEDEG